VTDQGRYVGVARPPRGVDPHAPRAVVNLTGPAPRPSTVDSALEPPPEPQTRPWVRATVAAAEIQPVRYGRFAEHRRRIRRAILRRYEAMAWGCVALVVAGLALVVVRGLQPSVAGEPLTAPGGPTGSAGSVGVAVPPVDCAFDPCQAQRYSGSPSRVRIPAIGVDSPLEFLGLDAQHQLEPPKDYQRAGWFSGGVAPGDPGAAVIAGHVDSLNGPAVFFELHSLRPGDLVEVDRGAQTVRFQVTRTEQYPKNAFPADRVYAPTPGPELRLITCGGLFDPGRGSYRDNIVVYAIAT
jgi:LPXTG-site transpeptidase (sortase) family protein